MDSSIPCPFLRFPSSCLRVSLIMVCGFIWLQGCVFLCLGVILHNFLKNFFTDGRGLKEAGGFPLVSVFLGLSLVLSTFLVSYFAVRPTRNRYFATALLMVALFIFELVAFLASLGYTNIIERVLKHGFLMAMTNYADGFVTNTELNLMQYMFNCCGAQGFRDWYNTTWGQGKMQVPESCCIDVGFCHNLEPVMTDDVHLTGCNEKITSIIKSQNVALFFVIACGAFCKFIGVIVSVTLGIKDIARSRIPGNVLLL